MVSGTPNWPNGRTIKENFFTVTFESTASIPISGYANISDISKMREENYREEFDNIVRNWKEGKAIQRQYDTESKKMSKFVVECGKKVSYIGKVYNVGKIEGEIERELVDNLKFKYTHRPKLTLVGRDSDGNIERIKVTVDELELLEKV